jgi:16S rRNA (cytosine1402-N4)-methyltransferase
MLDEAIGYLDLKPGDTALDATVGNGGHSIEILKRITPGGTLIGIDADASAVDIARRRLEPLATGGTSVKVVRANFRDLDRVLAGSSVEAVDAALFDVGVSSGQLDDPSRGFSIQKDGPLDMRIDTGLRISARDIVNRCSEEELSGIIRDYGQERFHRRIARRIASERAASPIETTGRLKEIVHGAVGGRRGYMRIDPATRTFQAIRIAVNGELGAMEEGIKKAVGKLRTGGRLCVISFHSLEDRIAKNVIRDFSKRGDLEILTKKPVRPSDEEAASNPRARSARLRAAERRAGQ